MYFDDHASAGPAVAISRWCVAPMWLALAPLLVFGLWWPDALWDHFMAAAQTLMGSSP
jgi:hydrogenase-4 component F